MQSINNFLLVKKEVKKEERSAGGIILTIPSAFDFGEQFEKRNIIHAEVMYANLKFPFLQAGDRIAMNRRKGANVMKDYESFTAINKNQFIAKIENDGSYTIAPDTVMVKISIAEKEALFSKWITRNDGTKVQLFLQPEPEEHSDKRSAIYVNTGEVTQVGSNVKGVEVNDVAILDYTTDNLIDNILYYDKEENKYIVIDATTTFHTEDCWVYGGRREEYNKNLQRKVMLNIRDQLVCKKGDMDIVSPLLGVVRNDKLMARQPYVFLQHQSSTVEKNSHGIMYSEKEEIVERKILSVSKESELEYGITGQMVIVNDVDIFDVQLNNFKVQAVIDSDILMCQI